MNVSTGGNEHTCAATVAGNPDVPGSGTKEASVLISKFGTGFGQYSLQQDGIGTHLASTNG